MKEWGKPSPINDPAVNINNTLILTVIMRCKSEDTALLVELFHTLWSISFMPVLCPSTMLAHA